MAAKAERRRIAPAVAMTVAIVGAVALAVLMPVFGVAQMPSTGPALVPPAPEGQQQIAPPSWHANMGGEICGGVELTTHYSDSNIRIWVGPSDLGDVCVTTQYPASPELGASLGGSGDGSLFNAHGTGGRASSNIWNASYYLLPANADISQIDTGQFEAATDHLLVSREHSGNCTNVRTIPTNDGSPDIVTYPMFC